MSKIDKKPDFEDNIKPSFKDYLAISIAIFELVMPMVIGGLIILMIVLLFITKVWFR